MPVDGSRKLGDNTHRSWDEVAVRAANARRELSPPVEQMEIAEEKPQ